MNCKVIVIKKEVKDEKGKIVYFNNYYLLLENGKRVAIKPSFKNDYSTLSAIACKE